MSQDQSGRSDEIMKRLGAVTDEALGRPRANTLAGALALDPRLAAALAGRAEISEELPVAVPAADVLAEIDAISEASAVGVEELAEAFLLLRPELASDEQALEVLQTVARQCGEMGVAADALAAMLVKASKRPEGREPAQRLLLPVEPAHPGRIVVPGGMRGVALPPARELDGAPDPALAAMLREGASRYHLETLARLDAESRRPAPRPLGRPARAAVLALATTAIVGASGAPHEPADEPEAPRHSPTRPVRSSGNVRAEAAPAPARPGCRSAGCRTFADCLCECASCEVGCHDRRRPRKA